MKFDGIILSVGNSYIVRSGPTGHLGTTYHHRTTTNSREATVFAKWDRRGIDSSIRWASENFPALKVEQVEATMLTSVVIKGADKTIDALVFADERVIATSDINNVDHTIAIAVSQLQDELAAALKNNDELVAQLHDHDTRRVAAMTQAQALAEEVERLTSEDVKRAAKAGNEAFNYFVENGELPIEK